MEGGAGPACRTTARDAPPSVVASPRKVRQLSDEVHLTLPTGSALPEAPPMPERREYPNPPIVESLVQFNFAEPIAWNVATPGRVFEHLRQAYPMDPEQQGMLQAAFSAQPGKGVLPDFTVTQGIPRVVYKDATKTRLVVLNDRVVSVNSLRPYEGWDRLAVRIREAAAALEAAVSIPLIDEVSVRYVNQIRLPRGRRTEDYFAYDIHTVRAGSSYLRNFVQRVESLLPDGVTTAGTTFASLQPETQDVFPIILDIEFKRSLGEGSTIDAALAVAIDLKRLENAEFESVITDNTRGLFQ